MEPQRGNLQKPLRYVMEATGVYHEDLANHLAKNWLCRYCSDAE